MQWYPSAKCFTEALASSEPTPGGGAAAAMAGAMGCALALMAIGTTLKRASTPQKDLSPLQNGLQRLQSLKAQLDTLIQQDSQAYASYLAARKLPQQDSRRASAIEEALWAAAKVPTDTAKTAVHCLQEIDMIKESIAPVIESDVLCAIHLLKACIRCAIENIQANVAYIHNPEQKKKLEKDISDLLKAC